MVCRSSRSSSAWRLAKGKLAEAAGLLGSDGLSWSLSYISGLLILLREGLEAILVLAAILAFLRNTGQQSAVRSVNVGWGLALVAGARDLGAGGVCD
jgi:high-affinity iron transporter